MSAMYDATSGSFVAHPQDVHATRGRRRKAFGYRRAIADARCGPRQSCYPGELARYRHPGRK